MIFSFIPILSQSVLKLIDLIIFSIDTILYFCLLQHKERDTELISLCYFD